MSDSRPRLFTIASDQPFLARLAQALLAPAHRTALFGAAPLDTITILVPTRRAARQLAHIFLAEALARGAEAVLLPRIAPLGDLDEATLEPIPDGTAPETLTLPPAIAARARHFRLLPLVRAGAEKIGQPLDAVRLSGLAHELESFLDELQNEQADARQLADIVPDSYAENWQKSLEFLSIITEAWPQFLREEGLVDPTERRNLLLQSRAVSWRTDPPDGPVIAAGSTGSIKATADLLTTIAHLPHGAVVLPGLDLAAPPDIWDMLVRDPSHPQAGMAHLLAHIGAARDDVTVWPGAAPAGPRAAVLNQALVPAAATDRWADERPAPDLLAAGLAGLSVLEAPDQQAEAGAIAVAMRETVEHPDASAALVTRDRNLARRVAAELRRWNIAVDDSAGQPLNRALPAALVRLTLGAAAQKLAPVPLLALLKHPLVRLGSSRAAHLTAVRRLEIEALRGPRPGPGLAALRQKAPNATALLARLETALAPLLALPYACQLDAMLAALTDAVQYLTSDSDTPAAHIWTAREDGRALAGFLDGLYEHAALAPTATLADWAALIDYWMGQTSLRRPGAHPRLFIWGPLEARLMQADLMILGGLNETSWPPMPETGPWLSRPMRQRLGLAQPERQIGLAAHDFVQAASAPRVLLTRAKKIDGTPSVAARWLRRLETLCGTLPRRDGHNYLAWWHSLTTETQNPTPSQPPAPCPPLAARPDTLSVTQIETLLHDPYRIYAQKILGLSALDPVDAPPAANHRGSFLHTLFEQLMRDTPPEPDQLAEQLMALADQAAQSDATSRAIMQFWQARLQAAANWFADFEATHRPHVARTHVETRGRVQLDLPDGPFTITATADRIDEMADGRVTIFDYKTGAAPSKAKIEGHLAVQMTLQAAMAEQGGFDGVPAAAIDRLAYLSLTGGTPPGRYQNALSQPDLPHQALAMVADLVAVYRQQSQPYFSHIRAPAYPGHTAFDHLARVKEWQQDEGSATPA